MIKVNVKSVYVTLVFMIMGWIAVTFHAFVKIVHMEHVMLASPGRLITLYRYASIINRIILTWREKCNENGLDTN